jgi:hypothetical protein
MNSGVAHGTLFETQESMPAGQITFIINININKGVSHREISSLAISLTSFTNPEPQP